MIITTKFDGKCECGASVKAGERVNWIKGSGIVVCRACALRTMRKETVKIGGTQYDVVIKGRDGQATRASVNVGTFELSGMGAIHIDLQNDTVEIGARGAMVRGELCDYIPAARAAVEAVTEN